MNSVTCHPPPPPTLRPMPVIVSLFSHRQRIIAERASHTFLPELGISPSRSPSEAKLEKQIEIGGIPDLVTTGRLLAAALSARILYRSVSTVPWRMYSLDIASDAVSKTVLVMKGYTIFKTIKQA